MFDEAGSVISSFPLDYAGLTATAFEYNPKLKIIYISTNINLILGVEGTFGNFMAYDFFTEFARVSLTQSQAFSSNANLYFSNRCNQIIHNSSFSFLTFSLISLLIFVFKHLQQTNWSLGMRCILESSQSGVNMNNLKIF